MYGYWFQRNFMNKFTFFDVYVGKGFTAVDF